MTANRDAGNSAVLEIERQLGAALATCIEAADRPERVVVAFSGGLDSTVLLHACARLEARPPLAAVHVDHRLHPDSASWARHCADVAAALGIDCAVLEVDAAPAPGQSPEAAARVARYAALERWLGGGDLLVTAHHGDDQLETLLLRILRGTGVRGLRAIRFRRRLGRGQVARPLLAFSRAELARVATARGLEAVVDPSNADLRFDRNYLRAEVLPAMRQRWPAAHRVAERLARHMEQADTLLEALAAIDAGDSADPARMPVARLLELPPARRVNLLRHLIRLAVLPVPDERVLAELDRQIRVAPDSAAAVKWTGGEARLYRRQLYLLGPLPPSRPGPAGTLDPSHGWSGPEGRLHLERADGAGLPGNLIEAGLGVAFRRGGERFVPAGSRQHKSLKHWFQEQHVVPWMRDRMPLLFAGGELVAVADLAVADIRDVDAEPRWRPVWSQHPRTH